MHRDGIRRLLGLRSWLHRAAFRASGGRLLRTWGGLPVLLLTTTGRHSGRNRSTILVAPVIDGESLAVVASDGGAPRHPAWYLNLCAEPDVAVLFRGRWRRMRARTVHGAERRRVFERVVARAPAYGRYAQRTSRILPVVLLEPPDGAPGGRG
jgi:deazaflavin-dependent oxidoreductase (nitroreductase family)